MSLRTRLTPEWRAFVQVWEATQGQVHWGCWQQTRRELAEENAP